MSTRASRSRVGIQWKRAPLDDRRTWRGWPQEEVINVKWLKGREKIVTKRSPDYSAGVGIKNVKNPHTRIVDIGRPTITTEKTVECPRPPRRGWNVANRPAAGRGRSSVPADTDVVIERTLRRVDGRQEGIDERKLSPGNLVESRPTGARRPTGRRTTRRRRCDGDGSWPGCTRACRYRRGRTTGHRTLYAKP